MSATRSHKFPPLPSIVPAFLHLLTGDEPCVQEGAHPEDWFDYGAEDPRLRGMAPESAAARLCEGCPSLEPCRTWAVASAEEHGIWGGTTPDVRARMRRITRLNPPMFPVRTAG